MRMYGTRPLLREHFNENPDPPKIYQRYIHVGRYESMDADLATFVGDGVEAGLLNVLVFAGVLVRDILAALDRVGCVRVEELAMTLGLLFPGEHNLIGEPGGSWKSLIGSVGTSERLEEETAESCGGGRGFTAPDEVRFAGLDGGAIESFC